MWGLTLAAVVVVLLLLQRVTAGAPLDARATLALGGLLLIAHLGGVIARRMGGPRVAGYLLAGLLAGPSWLGLVPADELAALRMLADAALALIAFAVGCELRPSRALPRARDAAVVLLPFFSVAFVAFTVAPWFQLTRHQPLGDALAVALTLGAVAAVSSPTLAHAVLAERQVPEPLSREVQQVSSAQLLAVAVLVPLLLALVRPLTSAGAMLPGAAVTALVRLAGGVLLGLALGYAVVRYLTSLRGAWHPLFILLAGVLLIGQGARWLGIDVTVAALAAGVTAGAFGPPEADRLRNTLRTTAAPAHLVAFAWVGCALRFEALRELWPWVLLFAGLRLVALRAAWAWRAPAHGGVGVEGSAWLGLVPQGAFAVTLGGMTRQVFPEWGISLETLIVAMIGVHALAGPVVFHAALRNTVREDEHVTESSENEPGGAALVVGGGGGGGRGGGGGGGARV